MQDDNVGSRYHGTSDASIPPLLVVSPTSPICKPSYLPTAVTSRPAAAVNSWSSGLPSPSKTQATQLHHHTSRPGLRHSRIPVRSARKAKDIHLGSDMTARVGRSNSLSKLTDEDLAHELRRSQERSPSPSSPRDPKLQQHYKGQSSCYNICQASPRTPLSHRHSFSGKLPGCRGTWQSTSMLKHESYQSPQYFNFHLTLRNPSNSPLGVKAKPLVRNSTGSRYSAIDDESRDVGGQEAGTTESDDNLGQQQDDNFNNKDTWQSCTVEERPRCRERENSSVQEGKRSNKGGSSTRESTLDSESLVASRHCNNFGIVDYLNTIMQDSEQDDTESYCSDYGSGLATSPPGRLSDTDSTIEAISVSSDLPLKTFPISRLSSSLRKKPNLKTLRWRSCQELLKPHETKTILKRQLSDQSLKCLEEEQILPGGSVEVYDGNLGVSRVTLSRYKHNQSSSSAYNHTSLTAPDEDINGHISEKLSSRYTEFSVKTIDTDCSSKPRTNRVSAREKRIAHVESGKSLDFGCHDSQRVEVSDSLCGERMEIDDCILPPLASSKQANLAPLETYSNQHSLPGSKRQSPRAFKSNESSCNENEESVLGKQYGRDPSVPSTKKTYNDDLKLLIKMEKMSRLRDFEVDQMLGIQDDDGSGPGLSEDEHLADETSPTKECEPSQGVDIVSPRKLLWCQQKDARRRSNDRSVRRLHPLLSNGGRTASKAVLIAPPEYRLRSSGQDRSVRQVSVSDTSQPSSARGHPSRVYSETTHGDSSTEDSDTGIELSELERCVLTLTHRRSQLRKQDTNAFLIAPPEYKISEDFTSY